MNNEVIEIPPYFFFICSLFIKWSLVMVAGGMFVNKSQSALSDAEIFSDGDVLDNQETFPGYGRCHRRPSRRTDALLVI